ncbi:hypothetical protein H7K06_12755 [Priestia aryabhattai]|uniref:DUF6395 domain-containing protein n=1 Tax=Priestia aryabhattai TaxID=412384 RepID=UPI001C8EEF39|nr:DUF6395 domain-containing protein [Priestia aryabhattai]MBX9968377.1 hypothetical protein [Priestia aryabhattai]
MRVKYDCSKGILMINFSPENYDTISYQIQRNSYKSLGKVSLGMRKCEIHLPEDWTLDSVHPDLLALATISIIYPFIGPNIFFPMGVSNNFHNTFKKVTGKEVLPINPKLIPRKAKADAVPALAYSGGIDSTAASILLPHNTNLFYIDRITPSLFQNQKTLLNQEAAYYACDSIKKLGHSVYKVKTDLQYVRSPIGFSTYLADSVPALLLADYYGFDTLANGHTLEEGYQVGYNGFQDAKETQLIKIWGELLNAVDMPLSLPTIGLSEVSTTKILINNPSYNEFAQACSRGKVHKPCMNCYKCFRKSLLEMVIKKESIEDSYLNRLFKIKDAQQVLKVTPIHFENVITYITSKYKGNHRLMNLIKKKTRGDYFDTTCLEKWYSPSLELIAPKYQEHMKKEILKNVDPMNNQDLENIKKFDYKHTTNSYEFTSYDNLLQSLFSNL